MVAHQHSSQIGLLLSENEGVESVLHFDVTTFKYKLDWILQLPVYRPASAKAPYLEFQFPTEQLQLRKLIYLAQVPIP